MGNWPDVAPGESVQHSARRENEINAILKASDLFKDGRLPARSPQSVRVQAYNATTATIQAGQAAQIDLLGTMCQEAFPVVAYSDPDAPFGVFAEDVEPNACAPFILTGPATVQITGSTGSYAMPTEEGAFERGEDGVRILNISGGTEGIVLLGHYHVGSIYAEGIGITITGGTEGQPDTINANITGDDTYITVTGGTAGGDPIVISFTGSAAGGIGFPDYVALSGGTHAELSNDLGEYTDEDYEDGVTVITGSTIPDNPVFGVSYVMPCPPGAPIKYYASAACLVRYAPFLEEDSGHYYFDIGESMEWTPEAGGWLRISILDDGGHPGDCIRIYIGGVDYTDALPIFKCGRFGGATGISATVSGGTAFITLSGATGSARFVGDGTVEINGNTNNEIVLSAVGGGSGWIPNWGTYNHTAIIPATADAYVSGYTAGAEGYVYACAFFDPFKDGFRYRHYQAHVSINGACFKVCELKLGGDDLYLKVANSLLGTTQYDRDTDEDYTNKISVEVWDPAEYKTVKLTYTRNYGGDYEENGHYTYFAWYCYNAHRDEEDDTYDYRTIYTDKWHITGSEDIYLKKYDENDDPYFDYFGSCSPVPDYTYFAWKSSGNDYVFTSRADSNIKPGTSVYEPDEQGQFISGSTISTSNIGDISAVGIGAGIPIPFRKNSVIYFVAQADGNACYVASGSIPSVFCVVYEKPASAEQEEEED